MSSFFSSDGSFPLQFAIIFVVIFLVLAAGVFLLRRFTGRGTPLSNKTPPRGRQPRLGIVDIYELDRQRQLILLRRDNVEHLLLVGGPNDVVVERNITRGINARLPTEETAYDEPPEQAPANPSPPTPISGPSPSLGAGLAPNYPPSAPYLEPSFAMPVVVPAPEAAAAGARPPELPPQLDLGSDLRAPQASAAPRPKQKESQFARVIRRAPPGLANLVPAALAERVRLPERAPEAPPIPAVEPPPFVLPAAVPVPPPASPVSPPAARAIDAAILSDMARQLEEALRRPAAAVRPPVPAQPEPQESAEAAASRVEPEGVPFHEPEPVRAEDIQAVDPIAAAMAATAQEPVPTQEPVSTQQHAPADAPLEVPPAHDALFAEDEAHAPPADTGPVFVEPPEPVVHAVIADAPVLEEPAPAVTPEPDPEPVPAPPPAPAPKPAASPNPFSVEEIEAEFARLLGRPLDRKH
ncbi:hypothetical protein [Methylobacterium sp. J-068]|uniref:hypothetical protein n=1 Tax=Methylobacterium sp. J-068 TaxID=2836649 RepID=UPI001FBB3132|nr:hypothetical protein [Methylobacterium sp. J-068]MCJ2034341.1 hypothetical protein [Methylobacterium sp. J-068]